MGDLNLLGIQVYSMVEAIKILGCTKDNLIWSSKTISINGFSFIITTYTADTSKDFLYAVTASNLQSNQYED